VVKWLKYWITGDVKKKVNMQRKMGVKGENEVALFDQRYCKPEL
jgi:hypothetical protein